MVQLLLDTFARREYRLKLLNSSKEKRGSNVEHKAGKEVFDVNRFSPASVINRSKNFTQHHYAMISGFLGC